MNTEKYIQTEKFLHSSAKFQIKLGLERISAILKLLGNPQEKLKVIHIAGTNGKGSVCTITADILKSAGYKTALYTSPHLFKYNERFKINGEDISDENFALYIKEVNNTAEKNGIDLSEFEILTAAAYWYFYDQKAEFAVMETGLGGRFDAVNAVQKPLITAITSISIDHKDRLGDTIEKISFEKAGIIKRNTPIIINSDNSGFDVIKTCAKEKNAPLFVSSEKADILYENNTNYALLNNKKYEFNLWGLHQKQNLELVLKITEILKEQGIKISEFAVEQALKTVFIPARFQYNKKYNLITDGAHNFDAAKKLLTNLEYYFPNTKRNWIYGVISTKEYEKAVNILFKKGDTVCLQPFDYPLAVSPENIEKAILNKTDIKIKNISKTENILNYFSQNSLTIITGSFYMIGQIVPKEIIL